MIKLFIAYVRTVYTMIYYVAPEVATPQILQNPFGVLAKYNVSKLKFRTTIIFVIVLNSRPVFVI